VAFPSPNEANLIHQHLLICLVVIWFSLCMFQLFLVRYTSVLTFTSYFLTIIPFFILLFLLFSSIYNGAHPVFTGWGIASFSALFLPKVFIIHLHIYFASLLIVKKLKFSSMISITDRSGSTFSCNASRAFQLE